MKVTVYIYSTVHWRFVLLGWAGVQSSVWCHKMRPNRVPSVQVLPLLIVVLLSTSSLNIVISVTGHNLAHQTALASLEFGHVMFHQTGKSLDDSQQQQQQQPRLVIYLGGLFDLNSLQGRSELDAVRVAIAHVNEKKLLGNDLALDMVFVNSGCDDSKALNGLYGMIHMYHDIHAILGPSCSETAKTVAHVAYIEQLVQVSFAASSPTLSERAKYPTFFRTCEADAAHNMARALFVTHFHWYHVATLTQSSDEYNLAAQEMSRVFHDHNISVTSFEFTAEDLQEKLQLLLKSDYRIIIGKFSEEMARRVFCQVFHMQLPSKFVWILPHQFRTLDWTFSTEHNGPVPQSEDLNCTQENIQTASDGYFAISSPGLVQHADQLDVPHVADAALLTQLSLPWFNNSYQARNGTRPLSLHALDAYDSVWMLAHALHGALQQFSQGQPLQTLPTPQTLFPYLFREVQNSNFHGLSGDVVFEGANRVGKSAIYQNQNGSLVVIGQMPNASKGYILKLGPPLYKQVVWKGSSPPLDRVRVVILPWQLEAWALWTIRVSAALGCFLAVGFLAFNCYFRNLKFIKLSSPRLNNMAAFGSLLLYVSVPLGVDDQLLKTLDYRLLCPIRIVLFLSGFTFQFGAIFAKTFRVYEIFRPSTRGIIKKKILRDAQLMGIVGALFAMDLGICITWLFLDPLQRRDIILYQKVYTSGETRYTPQISSCSSGNHRIWTGLLLLYKGLLLMFGVYMAWSTRHVRVTVLNDSQFIGISVYNVVLAAVILLALKVVLEEDEPDHFYLLMSVVSMLSTTTTLLLLFLPKIFTIVKHGGKPMVRTSHYFHESATTRTLPCEDESRERFQRAEIQNRVFRREGLRLQKDIARVKAFLTSAEDSECSKSGSRMSISLIASSVSRTLQQFRNARKSMDFSPRRPSSGSVTILCSSQSQEPLHSHSILGRPSLCRVRTGNTARKGSDTTFLKKPRLWGSATPVPSLPLGLSHRTNSRCSSSSESGSHFSWTQPFQWPTSPVSGMSRDFTRAPPTTPHQWPNPVISVESPSDTEEPEDKLPDSSVPLPTNEEIGRRIRRELLKKQQKLLSMKDIDTKAIRV